jgi:predicted Zn-dependent peptidase
MKKITIKGPNEVIYEEKLENGLRVFIWPKNYSNEVSLTLTVKYGSIHTDFDFNNQVYKVPKGTAHFLEHIKFNESNNKTAHDYFYAHGSYVNAYTTYDHTSYDVTCNKDYKENLKHLLTFVYNPFFTKELTEKEKPIIIEESKMVLDNPYNKGYQKLANNFYINSNRQYLITGKEEDILKITKEDTANVYNHYYHPANMFLTICGNVDIDEMMNTVEEFMLSHPMGSYTKPTLITKEEPLKVKKINNEISVNVAMSKLMLNIKLLKKGFKDFSKIRLLNSLRLLMDMNFGSTSLFDEYLLNKDLKDEFYYYVSIEEDVIVISFEVSTKYPNKVLELILNKFKKLDINEEDFNRKIKSFIANSIMGFEDVNEVSTTIISNIIKYDQIIDDYLTIIKSINIQDLKTIKSRLNNFVYSSMILKPKE